MSISDQHYLLTDQYKNAANLNARVQLHARFGEKGQSLHRWIFDHFTIAPGSKILELGCGPGLQWLTNRERIPADWQITLSDFSPGMLQEAQHNLQRIDRPFSFQVIDAQEIPFENETFDAVIANHMLYHVPDRAKAIAEIRRVLQPDGRFYASTIGRAHMRKIGELMRSVHPDIYDPHFLGNLLNTFRLENGDAEIAQSFAHVETHRHEKQLVVTETEPLMAYILSGRLKEVLSAEMQKTLRERIKQEIQEQGAIRIDTVSGMFIAYGIK